MHDMKTEVVVLGLGAMGSATLWQLAERGIPAIGIERFQPGHDRGSSHGETRIFRTAYLEGPGYVPLAQRSVSLWRQLQDAAGVTLLTENGALMIGPRQSSVITGTMRSVRAHSLAHEFIDEHEVRTRFPAHRLTADDVAIYEKTAGFMNPEKAVRAMVARARHLGAVVISETVVERLEPTAGGIQVSAGDVICNARHAIVSVGSWLGKLLPDLRLPLRVTRQVPGWYPIERPEDFQPDRFPVFLRDLGESANPEDIIAKDTAFYGFPTLDGHTVKVSIHREGPLLDPDRVDRSVKPEELALVKECIQLFLNGVGTEPVRTQVCMYTNTPDHDFLIGSPAAMPWLTILGGGSGHAFKFAPVIGEVGADLATHGGTDHSVAFLSPNRFLPGAAQRATG